MFHIALTPNEEPSQALSAFSQTLIGAIAELLSSVQKTMDDPDWIAPMFLEACKEAVENLENDQPAKGAWYDFSAPDMAFSIDIFNSDDVRYVRLDDNDLIVPHGAVGLVDEKHTTRWLYDKSELSEWDNVRLPQRPTICKTCGGFYSSTHDQDKCEAELHKAVVSVVNGNA